MYACEIHERQSAVRIGQLAEAGQPFWFCLKAAPKREHIAATTLRRELQVPVVAPRIRFRKLTGRGPVWFVEAMFPGYLFAEFIYRELHRRVVHTPGVTGLVRFGDHVPTIEPATLDSLRAGSDEVITFDRPLEVGETVKIAEGPLRGFEAVVTRLLPAAKRVQILLEFLGRDIEIAVHEPQIITPKLRTGT
jgi:transcriptional antiterminator RfaH